MVMKLGAWMSLAGGVHIPSDLASFAASGVRLVILVTVENGWGRLDVRKPHDKT